MSARELEIEKEMNLRGWDRDEAELVVDARLAKLTETGQPGDGGAGRRSAHLLPRRRELCLFGCV